MKWQDMSCQTWMSTAVRSIRFKPDREEVRRELHDHFEDKLADLQRIFPDIPQEEAERRAVAQMGDPEQVGRQLAGVHSPWLGYLWLCSKVLLGVLLALTVWFGLTRDYHDVLNMGPALWDWDDLPAGEEEIYAPSQNPDQLAVWDYGGRQDVTVNGQTVSLRRAALWQGAQGLELYVYFRVETWRFWERGELYPCWFTATDSLGNQYQLSGSTGEGERGPFFCGYQMYLAEVDPAAEWVRLDYGRAEPSFALTVDLGRS